MAFNNNSYKGYVPSGLDMTDIPGVKSYPHILRGNKRDDSRSQSPDNRYRAPGRNAEVLAPDLVKVNEDKVRKQILNVNKEGVSGPFIGFDPHTPAPKSPKIPLGSSSYNMHFSPGKTRDEMPAKLKESMSAVYQSPRPGSLRHISNGDAFQRHNYLSNSIDLGRKAHNSTMKTRGINSDKNSDDFRFKKNLTTNADRILTQPATYKHSPVSSSKFEEIRRQAQEHLNGHNSHHMGGLSPSKTLDHYKGQENFNSNNIQKRPLNNPMLKEPAGGYGQSSLKKTMGFGADTHVPANHASPTGNSMSLKSSGKIGQNVSVPNFNDPSYHRYKNFNNYGYDVLTGVRKESPNRIL